MAARSFMLGAGLVLVLAMTSSLAGAQGTGVVILAVKADVVLAIPVESMVENTSRTEPRVSQGPTGAPTSDSSKCGPAAGSRPDYLRVDADAQNITFQEGNVSASTTPQSGAEASTTGCGEIGFWFTPPPGVARFTVAFASGRAAIRPHSGNSQTPAANCVQELHVAGDAGGPSLVVPLFDPAVNRAGVTPFRIDVALPPGNASANVTFYFADKGADSPVQTALVAGAGANVECTAFVREVTVLVLAQDAPFGGLISREESRDGDLIREATRIAFTPPTYPGFSARRTVTVVLAPEANVTHIESPDGARIELSELGVNRSLTDQRIVLPDAVLARHGDGTYAIALSRVYPAPPTPTTAPLTLFPLAFALLALPVLPGGFAAYATFQYSRRAHGRFVATARILALSLLLFVALYVVAVLYVVLAGRIPFMETLPLEPEGLLLDVLFGVLAVVLAALWVVPSRYALRVMEQDIEERRRAEAKFRGLLEAAPDAIVIVNATGSVVLTNAQAERIFGYSKDELVGRPVDALLPAGLAPVPGASNEGPVELEGQRRDGHRFPVEVSLSPIETEEGPLVTAAIRDITDRKRTQAELQRSNAELEHFAYIASHDLQEPLRTIAGFAQLLEQRYSPALDTQGKRYIERTVAGSQRMQQLINDLLAYSRVQTQGREFGPVALDAVVDQQVADLDATIRAVGGTVDREDLPVVKGDAGQLGQVFSNLIRNALKYRHPDRAPVVRITAERQDRAWRLTVRDNGIGIAPEYHEKVFVIFQRLQARGDSADGGTGLGLAITKRIVERHGGAIWLESEPGLGSSFHLTLPDVNEESP